MHKVKVKAFSAMHLSLYYLVSSLDVEKFDSYGFWPFFKFDLEMVKLGQGKKKIRP